MSQDNQNSQPPSSPKPKTSPGTRKTPSSLQTRVTSFLRWWSTALAKIRFLLPDSVSAKLSDTALTGVIVGIVVILVWTTSSLFTPKPTEVANVPPQQVEPSVTITTPTESVQKEVPSVAETTPPLPEPEIVLTPEQSLIAAIENQVAEMSDRFAPGLIQSIHANFRTSSLTIKINDDWFNLEQSEQEKLATEMLQRSKELDFSHLDIIDTQGRLVARNPVVGTEIIIFQRRAT